MKKIWFASIALVAMTGLVHADGALARSGDAAANAQIQQLVDTFQAAIIAKDGARLDSLFLPDSAWLSVYEDDTYRLLKAKHPGASKLLPDSHRKFTDFVSVSPKPLEEKFSNLRIDTDGTVGTVYFEYAFFRDGKQTNDGHETWQLVNTDAGWKISAMLYSVRLDPSILRQTRN